MWGGGAECWSEGTQERDSISILFQLINPPNMGSLYYVSDAYVTLDIDRSCIWYVDVMIGFFSRNG